MTLGRNDLCTCRSGLKYKKCCGSINPDAFQRMWIVREVERWNDYALANPDAEPGNTILKMKEILNA